MNDIQHGHTHPVMTVAITPDGSKIASGSRDGTIRIWDTMTGVQIASPVKPTTRGENDDEYYGPSTTHKRTPVNSIAFNFNGIEIVSGTSDGLISTIHLEQHTIDRIEIDRIDRLYHSSRRAILAVSISPDGSKIVYGDRCGHVQIRDLNGYGRRYDNNISTWDGSWILSVAFSPNGLYIVSGSRDRTVRIWDGKTNRQIADPLIGHKNHVNSVAFSPDGNYVVSGSRDGTIRVWDINVYRRGQIAQFGDNPPSKKDVQYINWVLAVAYSPDGSKVVAGYRDGSIKIWDLMLGKQIAIFNGHTKKVNSVIFSPDGRKIISGSDDCTIRIWDILQHEGILKHLKKYILPELSRMVVSLSDMKLG